MGGAGGQQGHGRAGLSEASEESCEAGWAQPGMGTWGYRDLNIVSLGLSLHSQIPTSSTARNGLEKHLEEGGWWEVDTPTPGGRAERSQALPGVLRRETKARC